MKKRKAGVLVITEYISSFDFLMNRFLIAWEIEFK